MPPEPRLGGMKRFLLALASILALSAPAAHAQAPHIYTQPELDSLLAPIALYPDGLITQVLMAARFPDQVVAASNLPKDAQPDPSWDPNVKALLAFPEILTRMAESPQWTRDLGLAFANQEPHVLDTVQSLRKRAQATGQLQSNDQQIVTQQDNAIVVEPRNPEVVYVRYYDPYVVYGPWWWGPAYGPVVWSPWVVRPAFVGVGFFFARPVWHTRQVVVVNRFVGVQRNVWVRPAVTVQRNVVVRDYHRVPESQRQPIIHNGVSRSDGNRQSQQQRSRSEPRQGQQRSDARQLQQRPQPVAQQQREAWHLRGDAPHAERNTAMPAAPRFSESRSQQPRASVQRDGGGRGGEMRGDGGGGGHGGGHGGGGNHGGGGQRGGRG
jgi:uncharacterized membrane protein YgcG